MISDLIFRLCLSETIDPVFLWSVLSQKTVRVELSRLANGSSGSMPNISKARLKKFYIPLPPLFLQEKYRKIVEKYWNSREKYNQYLKESENLFNSLLQRAFKGEL
jgi:type I restriction enzyme S subunit